MEVTYQPVLDKNEAKVARKISRDIYKHNKFRKMMSIGDILLYLFFLLPSIFLAFELMDWGEYLYDCYENILANYAGHILLLISVCCFFYAVLLRPYLNTKAFQSQVYEEVNKEKRTIRIQEDGLYSEIALYQTLYNYRYIHHIENHYGYLTIRISSGQFLSIPHSAFQDNDHREAFEAALREKIKAYQAEPLSK
ncbi:MAG: YcxB family protein [Haemophilus influenzae]|nr:YcxB family protein [Haemophilus influenzae]MBF1224165.1 YcxB family protein [Haemophilus parainfluenzae]